MSAHDWVSHTYAGVEFKSRLEARWARFFDALGAPWEYEPRTFRMRGQEWQYTPDFHLPEERLWVEVKGRFIRDDKYAAKLEAYAHRIVTRKDCDLFILVVGYPSSETVYGALSESGVRRFQFADLFGEERAKAAQIVAGVMQFDYTWKSLSGELKVRS